jgi:cysteinyl-tRNA synthetase
MDQNKLDAKTAVAWLNSWNRINKVLDFESDGAELPEEVAKLAEARAQARLAKDFRKSDELRDKLNALGWEARDTKDGQKITRRAGA